MECGARPSACAVALLAALLALVPATAGSQQPPTRGAAARMLAPRAFAPVPLGRIRPSGWMKTQIHAQVHMLLSAAPTPPRRTAPHRTARAPAASTQRRMLDLACSQR
jgi:hypothetical protein